ncbi:hypothetical protein ACH5RR_023384 [Cinchona calisaya]|uniref:Uncharacterized protein n=1 Tax=Cinchona calisaya TaxID=153742 RepID=A0ABD2ZEE1_9GENT
MPVTWSAGQIKFQFYLEIQRTLPKLGKELRERQLGDDQLFNFIFVDNKEQLEEKSMAQRTLRELAAPTLNQRPLCITYPELDANVTFKLKSRLIHLLPSFHGLPGEDPLEFQRSILN